MDGEEAEPDPIAMAHADGSDAHSLETRGPVVLAVTIAMLACSTVVVTLRLISRSCIVRKVGWDDHFIILAWLIAFGMSVAICYGTSVGLGRHEVDIPAAWVDELRRSEYVFSVLYVSAAVPRDFEQSLSVLRTQP